MKRNWLVVLLVLSFSACKKSGGEEKQVPKGDEFKLTTYAPLPVQKQVAKKVYVHLMPWFENKETNSPAGSWGQHWTMANKNPEVKDAAGQAQIASHYYPLTGPYASGDLNVIEYQLLLMKFSGIDGVLIDWPGVIKLYDYPLLVRNTEKLISLLEKTGLSFAIVYEDQNINIAYNNKTIDDKMRAAQNDMTYLEDNYFGKSTYIRIEGKPLLMVFGPQTFQAEADWTQIFSVFSTKPAFFTLWNESGEAGKNAAGEFGWVYKNHLADLNTFYSKVYSGTKVASVYPGFNAFYTEGGWGSNPFSIQTGLSTFNTTLDLALKSNANYLQLVTWNDYGEGTMIEPTKEFQYTFLTALQQKLGLIYTEDELKTITTLYTLRKKFPADAVRQQKMDQVYYNLVSLKVSEAKQLLSSIN